jgi:Na+/melibiose symporter-like transporter
MLTALGRSLAIATIPLLDFMGMLSVWWIYAVAFISSTLAIAFDSGEFAVIPSLVGGDDLVAANGRVQASNSATQIAGPLLGGALIAVGPLTVLFVLDAGTFVASAVALSLVTRSFNLEPRDRRTSTTIRSDIVEGLRYVLGHPILRNISIMMALVNFVGVTTQSQLVLFAKERLSASDAEIGVLFSAGSAGIVILSLAAGPLRRRWSFSRVALGALVAYGALTIVFAANRYYPAAIGLQAAVVGLGILFNINTASLRQAIVPNQLLGRIVSIASVLAWSAIPLGSLAGGAAIEWTGSVALVYAVIGGLIMLIAGGFSRTALGHADDYLPSGEVGAERDVR